MTLQKDAAVELRNRLTNLYDATVAVIGAYVNREGRRINRHYLDIDLAEIGMTVTGPVPDDNDGYRVVTVQMVGYNSDGLYFVVVKEDEGTDFPESEVYNQDEFAQTFTLDLLVEIAENLERIVTDNE